MTARLAPQPRRPSSNPHRTLPRGRHTPPPVTPSHHLGHELLSALPQDPRGALHAPSPSASPVPPPDPNPIGDRAGRGWQVVRGLRCLLQHTLVHSQGALALPLLTPSSCLPTHQARDREGPAWGAWEVPFLRPWATQQEHPSASAPHRSPLGLAGARGSQDPSHHHLPVLPRFQKRLPVSLACPCAWGLG